MSDKPITELERDWVERHRPFWNPYHQAADEEDAFLDGDRYEDNEDWFNRDRRLVQIRGKETEDGIQHDVAVWSLKPRNLQARPIDQIEDPTAAEVMLSLIQNEITRADKGFDEELYKAVMAAHEHRCGIVWFDWLPDEGKWGEIFFGEEDFRQFMWDPSYAPHHPLNDRLLREKRIHVDVAREMYNAPWLEPDRTTKTRLGRPDRVIMRAGMVSPQNYDDDKTTLWQFWHKRDKSKKTRDKANSKDMILPPDQRYMSCVGGCGYRSPRQGDVNQQLPEMMDQGCPTCGGNLERIDSLGEQETVNAYNGKKRLVIMSAFGKGDDDGLLYDGNWPVSRCRSYPGIFIFHKVRSGRPMGGSKVSWAWDQQIASDQLLTMAVQQVFESRPVYIWPKAGITDRDGRRYEKRDDQGNHAFRDDSNQFMRPNPVDKVDGSEMDRGLPMVYGMVRDKLQIGKADLGLTEESSRDIAASSIAQQVKQEELPNADFTKRTRRAVAQGLNVLGDMITATYPPAKLARLNIEGVDMVLPIWGQDLPGFDFEIEDTPEFSGLEKARVESLKMLEEVHARYTQMGLPPEAISELISIYAEEMHFPPSTVRKFQKAMMAIAQAQQMLQQQQMEAQQQQQAMMEDQAAQDLETGLEVPGLPLSIGSPEDNGSGMVPGQM